MSSVAGFTGPYCSDDIDECLATPCLNGALCENIRGSFKCHCPPKYAGSDCSCGPANCTFTGGCNLTTSSDALEHFTCVCDPGRYGDFCELEVCFMNPCNVQLFLFGGGGLLQYLAASCVHHCNEQPSAPFFQMNTRTFFEKGFEHWSLREELSH